ncbi:MAG: BrnT family toxin, partial [Treponema sp.]|nr:BrnT family toxin [Treponema sp.]
MAPWCYATPEAPEKSFNPSLLTSYTISYYNKTMEERRIVWDEAKNEKNKQDHDGLGFETAQYVFADSERIWRFDRSENNTSGEERWQTIGKVG